MDTVDAMKTYIQRTGIQSVGRYVMNYQEVNALYQMAIQNHIFDALLIAFRFGRAKGYSMAKKELRHGKGN